MQNAAHTESPRHGVLIVEDDPVYRLALAKILEAVPEVRVLPPARGIDAAKHAIKQGDVSVVTLDVVLNRESGLDLLPWVIKEHPHIRVILVTSGQNAAARTEVDAIFLGASALLLKPENGAARKHFERDLFNTVREMTARPAPRVTAKSESASVMSTHREIVAVGASTGGPPVVMRFLHDLRDSFDAPILLVQHMPAGHLACYAENLAGRARRPVLLARDGELVQNGRVYVAPGDVHMQVVRLGTQLAIHLDEGAPEHYCRPAVDPLFRSVATACGPSAVGVVMTGMGSDGAAGALALRKVGAPVVVQDRESSVVWGMPGAVAQAGAANAIVSGAELAEVVMRWTSNKRENTVRGTT
jgi:two-component system chemotaxis response regulator CheB